MLRLSASMKLLETDTIFAFMDIGPIAKGHCLVIPKRKSRSLASSPYPSDRPGYADHAAKLVDLPEDQMTDILPACKKLAAATVRVP